MDITEWQIIIMNKYVFKNIERKCFTVHHNESEMFTKVDHIYIYTHPHTHIPCTYT